MIYVLLEEDYGGMFSSHYMVRGHVTNEDRAQEWVGVSPQTRKYEESVCLD